MIRPTHIPRTNHAAPPSLCKNLYRFSSGPKKEIFGVFPEFFRYPPSYLRNSQKIPEDFFTPRGPAAENLARPSTYWNWIKKVTNLSCFFFKKNGPSGIGWAFGCVHPCDHDSRHNFDFDFDFDFFCSLNICVIFSLIFTHFHWFLIILPILIIFNHF